MASSGFPLLPFSPRRVENDVPCSGTPAVMRDRLCVHGVVRVNPFSTARNVTMSMMSIFLSVAWVVVIAAAYLLAVRFLKKLSLY